MRNFNLEDTFKLSAILDKMGIEFDLNKMMDEANTKDKDAAAAFLGGKMALMIMKKIHLAKNEVIDLISGLTGDDAETVKNYGVKKIVEVFSAIFKQEGFADFFKAAGESPGKK